MDPIDSVPVVIAGTSGKTKDYHQELLCCVCQKFDQKTIENSVFNSERGGIHNIYKKKYC